MKQEQFDALDLHYSPCRYGMSRQYFRGPKKSLDGAYVACVGGTATYGKFIDQPFPARLERALGRVCVNFGSVNGGVDAFINDPTIMKACAQAQMTVVQVMGANFLSNRFYSVHPRRNDRFLRASSVMQAVFPEVDFSDFTFTRHMLGSLFEKSPARFDIVVSELRDAWVARMRNMLGQIGPNAVLLWFSSERLDNTPWDQRDAGLAADPLFISAAMIDNLRPLVRDVVVVRPSLAARNRGTHGMFFSSHQRQAASEMLGLASHKEATDALLSALRPLLPPVT
ncbi:DUF6473 family protein [Loktanella sp. SALINAS62]|uniref:DUF6473 family protein n=1 Tax=Loktanella sp. SALINAS62 TaxID=2706124 RepID=UPI001B8A8DF8|nr:DUF6473 family protein [Loktanella sp. SALINAS62]MBS1302189.1 hypothetical protein [Loktanella sp. SALINAS62]